jgi:diguanylate cyclase (GGDEF)-like protein
LGPWVVVILSVRPRRFAHRVVVNKPWLIDRVADTTSHREREDLDRAVVQLLVEFLDASSVVLYQLLSDGTHPRIIKRAAHEQGDMQLRTPVPHDITVLPKLAEFPSWRECVQRRSPVHTTVAGGSAIMVFPVEEDSQVIGLLEIKVAAALPERDVRLVECILRILRNQTALLDYGERDTLTGLFNRKTFESRFEKICGQFREVIVPPLEARSWLGLLDIDHFKSVNDTYGHIIGDEVLLLVSQIMQRTLRGGDQLFRFGGEEFVVVLEDTHASGAETAFDRIRAAIENSRFPRVGKVTASQGYTAIYRQEACTTCMERADAALYFVKRHGRNGVRCFEHLVASGEITVKDISGEVELF